MSALSLVYCGMFAALMMIGANITSFVPFLVVGGVPITLQAFFAVLAGLLLGSRLGPIAITVYVVVGLAGAPVFAKFQGGFSAILLPTFGFIVSFILVAYVVGKIVEKNGSIGSYVIAGLVGMTINYLIGTNWMYFAYKFWANAPDVFTYKIAWAWMVPPLPKDIILSILAGIFGHRMYKVLKVRRAH
ncbi:biotin transporter BioY [Sporosarcina sp. Sa2YVA2]|uniref:Biotin transporter n=2 Tax=Sporosarcina quadrami TaxID=2762234 RepID=A0ABR8U6K7_9BACL|nr:biotin transporter BioY [Sporosarcina quadrami]